jgi:protein SCO1
MREPSPRRRSMRWGDGTRCRASSRPAAVLVAGLLLTACSAGEPTYNGIVRDLPLDVSAISLPDVTDPGLRGGGQVVDDRLVLAAADGRVLLVYFGFLSCPDICPTTLLDVRSALGQLDEDLRGRVDVAFVTVDPDRDGPAELAAYLRHFFPAHHAIRAEGAELDGALDAFLASAEILVGEDGTIDVAHTAILYAVDSAGLVRIEWPFGTSAPAMADDLRTLFAASQDPGGRT